MRPPRRADPIYPLTLTELAFIVIFLILLLTGGMIVRTEAEKQAAIAQREAALAKLDALAGEGAGQRLEAQAAALRQAERDLRARLAASGGADPEALVSELVRRAGAEADNHRLRKRVEDLDAQLSALEALREIVEAAAGGEPGEAGGAGRGGGASAAAELRSALEFARALATASGEPVPPGRERERAREYADALRAVRAEGPGDAADARALARENRDLRARTTWLRGQLEARGGRDDPPCWAEEATGKPQYLFTIELRDEGLRIEPAWPPERAADAERLPGVAGLLEAGRLAIPAFRERVAALDADSRARHCRHYVRLAHRVRNLATFNRLRYAVEEYFYKFEIR